jgi:hypothetical protein
MSADAEGGGGKGDGTFAPLPLEIKFVADEPGQVVHLAGRRWHEQPRTLQGTQFKVGALELQAHPLQSVASPGCALPRLHLLRSTFSFLFISVLISFFVLKTKIWFVFHIVCCSATMVGSQQAPWFHV